MFLMCLDTSFLEAKVASHSVQVRRPAEPQSWGTRTTVAFGGGR